MPEATVTVKFVGDSNSLTNNMKKAGESFSSKVADGLQSAIGKLNLGGIGHGVSSIFGGVSGALGSAGVLGVVGAIGGVIGILKIISSSIEEMKNTLKDASPSFKGMQDNIDKMYNMILKPIGDIMTVLMKPFLVLMMKQLQAGMAKITPILQQEAAGTISATDAATQIQGIVEDMLKSFGAISYYMNQMLNPIAADLAGFQAGIGIMFNTWLTGTGSYLAGFVASIGTSLGGIPPELKAQLDDILHGEKNSITSTIKQAGTEAKDPIKDAAVSAFNDILNAIKASANAVFGSKLSATPSSNTNPQTGNPYGSGPITSTADLLVRAMARQFGVV